MAATVMQQTEKMDRKGFIGGSDVASILGISPWKTAYELWEEKTTDWQEPSSEERDKVLRRGKKLEPMVIEMLQEERNVWVVDRNQVYSDSEYPFLRAEIDYEYILDNDLVERVSKDSQPRHGLYEFGFSLRTPPDNIGNGDVKTVHPFAAKDWGEEGTDEVPAYYVAQFQHGLMVKKRDICMVAALIGADDLRVYEVRRDQEIIDFIRQACLNFWHEHVLKNVPPPPQNDDDVKKLLSRFEGFAWEADPDTQACISRIKGIKEAEKRLLSKREGMEFQVKNSLLSAAKAKSVDGDSSKFTITDGSGKALLTWNTQQSLRTDVKKFQASLPDLAAMFTKTTSTRVLLMKGK